MMEAPPTAIAPKSAAGEHRARAAAIRAQRAEEALERTRAQYERVEIIDDRPAGSPLPLGIEALRVIVTAEGKLEVPDHSPLRDLAPEQRIRILEAILERRALQGDLNAIALRLAHHRWTVEMKEGRAAAQVHHTHSGSVTILDDLDEAPRKVGSGSTARKAIESSVASSAEASEG
jgi:hypothetical protein